MVLYFFQALHAVFISDAAKLENTHKDLTAYTDLESTANLTVKFRVNPVINSTVYWIIGDSVLQDINIQNTLKDEQIQATYFISHVTDEKLGKYTVQVINWAMGKHNKVTFPVVLKLRGKRNEDPLISPCSLFMHMLDCDPVNLLDLKRQSLLLVE